MSDATDEIMKSPKPRAKETGTPVLVRLQPADLQAIDDWRRFESDMPSRPEAIRRILDLGMKVPLHADHVSTLLDRSYLLRDDPELQSAAQGLKNALEKYYRNQQGRKP